MKTIYKIKPRAQQLEALKRSFGTNFFAYFMTMRTGKTKVAFDDAARAARLEVIDCLVVLAPNGVQEQWVEQAEEHWPDDVPYEAAFYSGGATTLQKRAFTALATPSKEGDASVFKILTLNIESCSSKSGQKLLREIVLAHNCMLVCDESTRIKTPGATRTKFLVNLSRHATMTRILNGTPITQSPLDLYSQFKFLDSDILGFSTFTSFRNRYAIVERVEIKNPVGRQKARPFYEHVVGYKNLDELEKKVAPYTYRLERKDVKGLPPIVPYKLVVELHAKQRTIYKEFEENACAHLGIAPTDLLEFFMDENKVEANNGLTQLLKAQQILGGYVKNKKGELQYIQHNRIKVLMDFVQDVQGKIIIWARFQPEIQEIVTALQSKYGRDAVTEFHGKIPKPMRNPNKLQFQNDESCLFLVGQPHAGGVGQTFDAADTIINYSNDYSLYARLQSMERATAFGKKEIALIDMICPGTIDDKILKALKRKEKLAEEFNYELRF